MTTTNTQKLTENLFVGEHGSFIDISLSAQLTQKFIAAQQCDIFCAKFDISVAKPSSLQDITNVIKSFVKDGRAVMPYEDKAIVITAEYKTHPVLVWLQISEHEEVHDISVTIHTHAEIIDELQAVIEGHFAKQAMAKVKWWYSNSGHLSSRDIYFPPLKTKLLPEFYPDMTDPNKFLDNYLASDASVLLLAGPPGTGKTTLLRHMIVDRRLDVQVLYDENLMDRNSIFHSFLFDDDSEVMIIEDADTLLSPRESGENKMMARFLSVSDGLIKLPNKKLIFTTNLTDFGKVDPALMRPGRCYDIVRTRPLALGEAQEAAKAAGVPIPTEKREYTVAELFNQSHKVKPRVIGFGIA